MSVVELRQHVRGHLTLGKQDIFWNLGSITPETISWDTVIPKGTPLPFPPQLMFETWSQALQKSGAHNTTPSSFRHPPKEETPPAEPITLPTKVDVEYTPPGPSETLPERDATVLSTKFDVEIPKDLLTGQATNPIKVETQVVPTTRSVVKLDGPLAPHNQGEGERWCVLVVTALIGRLNFGSHWSYPQRHGDCLSQESGL